MKTKIITLVFTALFMGSLFAQDRTTVNAASYEISDNLDLKAVASIFGDSQNLEDFERRLNDPKIQISNLDLNNDNQVDYLRVIESVEGNTHLIIIQSVLEKDIFQDVATVEVERDSHNNVQVQVVGDVYMYGSNYIYEPVYVHSPVLFSVFWMPAYRPYYSTWYWGYYPTYYHAWNPYPVYRYRRNVHVHINVHNHYNYVNVRRSERAVALHNGRRANDYERQYPNRSFAARNTRVSNRHELEGTRNTGTRTVNASPRSGATRSETATPRTATRSENATPRGNTRSETATPRTSTRSETMPRGNTRSETATPRTSTRSEASTPRASSNTRSEMPRATRSESTPRTQSAPKAESPRATSSNRSQAPREARAQSAPQQRSAQPQQSRGNGGGRGNDSDRSSGRR